jgi:hypothetical protein
VILEAVAVETVAVEMESTTPVAETAVEATPGLGTTVAPEVRVETRVCPLRGASTDVVVREPVIEEAVLIRLAPMSEATSSSRGGLELLDDNFIDPTVVARRMESWRHTEQWIKVCCEYPEEPCVVEYPITILSCAGCHQKI